MNNLKQGNNTADLKKDNPIKNFDDLGLVLSVDDISNILQISRVSAYELVATETFPKFYVGRRIKIPKKGFSLWLEQQTLNS